MQLLGLGAEGEEASTAPATTDTKGFGNAGVIQKVRYFWQTEAETRAQAVSLSPSPFFGAGRGPMVVNSG